MTANGVGFYCEFCPSLVFKFWPVMVLLGVKSQQYHIGLPHLGELLQKQMRSVPWGLIAGAYNGSQGWEKVPGKTGEPSPLQPALLFGVESRGLVQLWVVDPGPLEHCRVVTSDALARDVH